MVRTQSTQYFEDCSTVVWCLGCSTPKREVRVWALAGEMVLCSWARHLTFTVPDFASACKREEASLPFGGNQHFLQERGRGIWVLFGYLVPAFSLISDSCSFSAARVTWVTWKLSIRSFIKVWRGSWKMTSLVCSTSTSPSLRRFLSRWACVTSVSYVTPTVTSTPSGVYETGGLVAFRFVRDFQHVIFACRHVRDSHVVSWLLYVTVACLFLRDTLHRWRRENWSLVERTCPSRKKIKWITSNRWSSGAWTGAWPSRCRASSRDSSR